MFWSHFQQQGLALLISTKQSLLKGRMTRLLMHLWVCMSTKKAYCHEGGFILGSLKPVSSMKTLILQQFRHSDIQHNCNLSSNIPVVMTGLQAWPNFWLPIKKPQRVCTMSAAGVTPIPKLAGKGKFRYTWVWGKIISKTEVTIPVDINIDFMILVRKMCIFLMVNFFLKKSDCP